MHSAFALLNPFVMAVFCQVVITMFPGALPLEGSAACSCWDNIFAWICSMFMFFPYDFLVDSFLPFSCKRDVWNFVVEQFMHNG